MERTSTHRKRVDGNGRGDQHETKGDPPPNRLQANILRWKSDK